MSSSNSNVFIGKYNKVLYNTILLGFSDIKSSFNSCIADFDACEYYIQKEKKKPDMFVSIKIKCWNDLMKWKVVDYIKRVFPGMVCDQPTAGYNLTLYLAPVEESQRNELAERVASLRLYCLSSPLVYLCDLYKSNSITTLPVYEVSLNPPESLYLYGNDQNLNLTFSLHNSDSMNVFITQVFLQEFCDTQRTVPSAPLFTFSKGVPEDLKQESIATLPNVGFVTFTLLKKHMTSKSFESIVQTIFSFKSYLNFHLTTTKTYMHTVMRNKCSQWDTLLKESRYHKEEQQNPAPSTKH